jgi:glycosyltransferase involved in cell wall biosynthesis
MPEISVVIPLYNKGPYIERAITSVMSQSFQDFELIVVDDGSTDGGGEIVEAIRNPLLKLVRQENQGVSAARNRGIELARGEWIAFLDADDAWKPGFLEEIMNLRRLFPEAGALVTAYEFIDIDGSQGFPKFEFLPPYESKGLFHFFCQGALGQEGITASSVVVRKDVFEKLGGYKFGETKDDDRHMIKRERRFVKEPAVSETARRAIDSGGLNPPQVDTLREYVAFYQMTAARHCLLHGEKKEALKILEYARGTRRYQKEWRWYWTLLAKLPFNLFPKYEKIKNLERSFRKKFLKGFSKRSTQSYQPSQERIGEANKRCEKA